MIQVAYYILYVLVGLCVGSFLNALIYRQHKGQSIIKGRSACPQCQHVLGWADLVPVLSFMFLAGKCHYCSKKISWQYPIVEIILGLAFFFIFYHYGLTWQALFYCLNVVFLVLIGVYDWLHKEIPDRFSLPAIVIALFGSLLVFKLSWLTILMGGLVGFGFFGLQFLLSRGKWIGGGDLRLGLLMGVMLGWGQLLVALFLAYIIGSIVGLYLLARKKHRMKSQIAFGPFLAIGTLIALFWGQEIINWYLNFSW